MTTQYTQGIRFVYLKASFEYVIFEFMARIHVFEIYLFCDLDPAPGPSTQVSVTESREPKNIRKIADSEVYSYSLFQGTLATYIDSHLNPPK